MYSLDSSPASPYCLCEERVYYSDGEAYSVTPTDSSNSSLEQETVFGDEPPVERPAKRLLPLKELCSQFVGQNFPFGFVQLYPSRVPEDVQRRIAFWSFPTDQKKLLAYAKVMGGAIESDVECARGTKVTGMVQSGMYLTGTVSRSQSLDYYSSYSRESERESFKTYVQFDRGCITTTKCSCGEQNWCRHVLALCLARLDESVPLQLHPPISETLTNLDRDQLQKLVQYFLEKVPLEGVAAVQEIASNLLDKGSEINLTPGAPDLTAGGCPGDKPVWQMDKNVIISRLDSAYETKLGMHIRYLDYGASSTLQTYTAALVGFKEFASDAIPNTPSDLHTLLLYEDDNLAIVLKWALEKVSLESCQNLYLHRYSRQDAMTKDQKWVEWCFCRMLLPVMQMFFASPAISSSAKEDVTEYLTQCLQQDLPSPIIELLYCFMQIATNQVLADTNGYKQLLTHLQQALSNNTPEDSISGRLVVSDPALLHCAMAFVQYMDFYKRVSVPDIEDILVSICSLIFPTNLTDAASLQEYVAIRVDHGLQGISLPLLLEYGTTLLHCISSPDLAAELVFKLMGNQLLVSNCSKDVQVYYNWAAKAMISTVDKAETFTKACHEVKSKLADLSIQWLQQTCLALQTYPNPTATLTGIWSLMRLVCRCGSDCLKVVSQMTQELIRLLSSTLPISSPAPRREGTDSKDGNLPLDIMADVFTCLLVDLFTMLPAGDGQELFVTLCKVYPTPVNAKRSLEMVRYRYSEWRQCLLDGATVFSETCNATFFPRKPPMEGFERQLKESGRRYRYGSMVDQYASSMPQCDSERDEVLQLCRTRCSVSTSHISFLKQLHKHLQEAHAPLEFQLQLLATQVSNCLQYDWARRGSSCYGNRLGCVDHNRNDTVLASDEVGFRLQALRDMWLFCMLPENALNLLESVQNQATPRDSDVMCDTLMSMLDCEASLHSRIFKLICKISLKPGYILHAVNVIAKEQSNDECRTTFIQCAEAVGALYNQHKASGAAEEILLKLRVTAIELLRQAVCFPAGESPQPETVYVLPSMEIDVQSLMQVVCDSGQDALADLLALVVLRPGQYLLQSLKKLDQLSNYYFKDGGPSEPLQVHPFNETVSSLLEKRKKEIKTLVGTFGESRRVRKMVKDLQACFQFVGDEEAFTAFLLQKRLHPYWNMVKTKSKRLRIHMQKLGK